ncbi:MAG: DUF2974 domain-containing protein [Verrucomicrobiales bacterium]|nr:DUF2974 domain-containing protein [Verrucomicrobiales bacterium]
MSNDLVSQIKSKVIEQAKQMAINAVPTLFAPDPPPAVLIQAKPPLPMFQVPGMPNPAGAPLAHSVSKAGSNNTGDTKSNSTSNKGGGGGGGSSTTGSAAQGAGGDAKKGDEGADGTTGSKNQSSPDGSRQSDAEMQALAESEVAGELHRDGEQCGLREAGQALGPLAEGSYGTLDPEGFREVEVIKGDKDFDATVYRGAFEGRDSIIIAYGGTASLEDAKADASLPYTVPSQYDQAVALAQRIKSEYPGMPIIVTGHSLGGGMGAYAAMHEGLPAVVFNAAGPQTPQLMVLGDQIKNSSNVVQFNADYDPLTGAGGSPIVWKGVQAGLASLPGVGTVLGPVASVARPPGGPWGESVVCDVEQPLRYGEHHSITNMNSALNDPSIAVDCGDYGRYGGAQVPKQESKPTPPVHVPDWIDRRNEERLKRGLPPIER